MAGCDGQRLVELGAMLPQKVETPGVAPTGCNFQCCIEVGTFLDQ